jgi:hypothetical protein
MAGFGHSSRGKKYTCSGIVHRGGILMQRNTQQLREDIDRILAGMGNTGHEDEENQDQREPDTHIPYAAQEDPTITVHVHEFTDARVYDFPDGLIVIPKPEPFFEEAVIDTTLAGEPATVAPPLPQGKEGRISWLAYAPVGVVLLLVFASFLNVLLFPPIAHITLILKSAQVSLSTSIQTGRILAPLTLSQSATIATTGRGHQDAQTATGTVTFYNGLSTSQSVAIGTVLTGQDGISIATDQAVTIPPANPPSLGETSVNAHAINAGSSGNIQTGDINTTLATGLFAKNTAPFSGGQDERNYSFVTKTDIENAAIPLKAAVTQSVAAALQTQLKEAEQLVTFPCAPNVSADHAAGEEASSVKVTATLICIGVAYSENTLQQQATKLLTAQALKTVGPGFILYGATQITISHAIPTRPTPTFVLSLSGTWTYTLSSSTSKTW